MGAGAGRPAGIEGPCAHCGFSATGIPKSIAFRPTNANFLAAATINLNIFRSGGIRRAGTRGRLCACILNAFRRRPRS